MSYLFTSESVSEGHPEKHIRDLIRKIGYTDPKLRFSSEEVEIINLIHNQSENINQAVESENTHEQGAGDQGIMFGFACNQTENFMPVAIELSHRVLQILSGIRKEGKEMQYLQPDSKAQFTVEYSGDRAERVDTILVSTQHDELHQDQKGLIYQDFKRIVIPRLINSLPEKFVRLFQEDYKLIINPSGQFIKGGPDADTGLTGRKI
ncbi:MAG: methionine adenosyltransferase, partial [Bacteroidota bacterium]|nr:methionine adenosyltransferase [Bacteroidota bacterium]